MRNNAAKKRAAAIAVAITFPAMLLADDIVLSVERSLEKLGYDVAKPDGTPDQKTQIAITRFQMENGLPVTGEASVQLAAMLETKASGNAPPAAAAAEQPAAEKPKCVPKSSQEKVADTQKKAWGVGKIAGAASSVMGVFGGNSKAYQAAATTSQAAAATSSAASGAQDLGMIPDTNCEGEQQP